MSCRKWRALWTFQAGVLDARVVPRSDHHAAGALRNADWCASALPRPRNGNPARRGTEALKPGFLGVSVCRDCQRASSGGASVDCAGGGRAAPNLEA